MIAAHRPSAPRFFIVGCGRSGTTLLRAMLSSHNDVSIPPESYFTVAMLRRAEDFTDTDGRLRPDVAAEWLRRRRSMAEWGVDIDALEARWRAAPPEGVSSALADVYRAYGRAHGSSTVADKTPVHGRHIERLADAFPGASFVHLIRDGRDVAASLVRMPFAPNQFASALLYWSRELVRARMGGSRIAPGRYMELRYEELVTEPRRIITSVCDFVGLAFDSAMLSHTANADALLSGMDLTGHLQGIRRPVTAGVRDWRTDLAVRDQALAQALVGDLLTELGYEAGPSPGLATRGRALAWRTAIGTERRLEPLRTRLRRAAGRGAAYEALPEPVRVTGKD